MEDTTEEVARARSFIEKLNVSAAGLEPDEQAILVSLVTDDDVAGYGAKTAADTGEKPAMFGLDPLFLALDPAMFGLDPARFGLDPAKFALDPAAF